MRSLAAAIIVLLLTGAADLKASQPESRISLATVFSDHMVLQRDVPFSLWGTGPAGLKFELTLGTHKQSVKISDKGDWAAQVPAMPAGGPHQLTLIGENENLVSVEDILFGDVYLCSGQSNMNFPVSRSSGRNRQLTEPHEQVRLLTIERDSAIEPKSLHSTPPQWQLATSESVPGFSALCWFFARELIETSGVPLGLVHASWGGSQIEAWMSTNALMKTGGFNNQLELLGLYAESPNKGIERYAQNWEDWWSDASGTQALPWQREQQHDWKPVPGLMRDWKLYGDPEVEDHLGMMWFSHDFELSAEQAAQPATLMLGKIDAVDMSWVNGTPVGAQFGWATERVYSDLEGVLKPGINNVSLNIYNSSGLGGLLGPEEIMGISLANGDFVSLSDAWRYQKVDRSMGAPPGAPWFSINGLTGLYNAMLAPLSGLNFAAALWYQGESNASRASNYESLLTAMIADWRTRFNQSMKFIIVQLPGFLNPNPVPANSGWAQMRHAQQQVALNDENTGLVVTLGAGDFFDIHPTNKQVVGQRTADVAASLVYGHGGVVDGLAPLRAVEENGTISVQFDPAMGLLQVMGSLQPAAFEVCEEPPAPCRFVNAKLNDATVELQAPEGMKVHSVRHCWADWPHCNLYGASGLPVSSFEIQVSH